MTLVIGEINWPLRLWRLLLPMRVGGSGLLLVVLLVAALVPGAVGWVCFLAAPCMPASGRTFWPLLGLRVACQLQHFFMTTLFLEHDFWLALLIYGAPKFDLVTLIILRS